MPGLGTRRFPDRLAAFIVAMGVTMGTLTIAHSAAGDPLEYAVKAVYLYKFGAFVEWPASAFASPASAVNLCVAGADPFGASLDTTVSGQHIGARPIVVRHLTQITRGAACQILFVGGANPGDVGAILDLMRGASVLTVTDVVSTGKTPSIIRFVLQDGHVRFVIDGSAASLNGIVVSSKLLSLALPSTGDR
jgi:YfiR/HmsC-like